MLAVALLFVPCERTPTAPTAATAGAPRFAADVPLTAYAYTNIRRTYACDPESSYSSGTYSFRQQLCWRDGSSMSGKNGHVSAAPTVTR